MLEAIELLLVGAFAMLSALFTARAGGPPPERQVVYVEATHTQLAGTRQGGRAIRRVGPYALMAKIAAGAMGEVYRARDTRSGHLRAVKLLPRDASAWQREQFEREARAGARLEHPNSVAVYDHGSAADGTRWLGMELLDGISLEELVEREGPQPPERVVAILRQTAAALAELHEHGLVHRDIKPQNILWCRGAAGEPVAKLIDFGLVKDRSEGAGAPESAILGTPLYISPEALTRPDDVDGRSDLYGLGAVAHFLLTGAPVFSGRSVIEVCSQHLFSTPEPISQIVGWIDDDLERIVLDCLAKEPSARPASARDLIRRLEGCAAEATRTRSVTSPQHLAIAC